MDKFTLKKIPTFDIVQTLECGQVFRYYRTRRGSTLRFPADEPLSASGNVNRTRLRAAFQQQTGSTAI